jgi:hypothetical protein
MDKEQRRAAKTQLVAGMQVGHSWQTATAQAGLAIRCSNGYRLWLAFQQHSETALQDGRHDQDFAPQLAAAHVQVAILFELSTCACASCLLE